LIVIVCPAVQILNELAPLLGRDLIKSFVCHEMVAFADDPIFRVRKAAAQNFGNVCATAGGDVTVQRLVSESVGRFAAILMSNRLRGWCRSALLFPSRIVRCMCPVQLPAFVKLSSDVIWGVRKGCVESLVSVAKVVPPEDRSKTFIPMFERFTKDASRWVRNGAFEVLGPFIHVLGTKLVSRELLRLYTTIPDLSNAIVDQEVTFFCAFNLPAVALTLGPERWDELVECFDRLVKDSKFHVRRTLACSLHELAAILGFRLTEKHLVPAMDLFLKDLDEVKVGILKNLAKMLKWVRSPMRYDDGFAHARWQCGLSAVCVDDADVCC
jgi:serine/threonine-protein phosphatase 4 regulatory subunit 1